MSTRLDGPARPSALVRPDVLVQLDVRLRSFASVAAGAQVRDGVPLQPFQSLSPDALAQLDVLLQPFACVGSAGPVRCDAIACWLPCVGGWTMRHYDSYLPRSAASAVAGEAQESFQYECATLRPCLASALRILDGRDGRLDPYAGPLAL